MSASLDSDNDDDDDDDDDAWVRDGRRRGCCLRGGDDAEALAVSGMAGTKYGRRHEVVNAELPEPPLAREEVE
jgi:hypothetical protein